MLKRYDIRINHGMGECLYTVDAKNSKSAIEIVEKEWHKDHKDYSGKTPKFTVQKTYTHAEKKSLGGLLLALVGGMYIYKVYSNKKSSERSQSSLENYRSESGKYAKVSSRGKSQDPDDMFQQGEARKSRKAQKERDVKDVFADGGHVKIYDPNKERLSRPNNDMEKHILERVQFDPESFVGNFAWRTPSGKLAEGYLYALDDFDKTLIKDIKLKDGEKIFRYFNRTTAIGGMQPMIKINVDKSLIYFTQEMENPDYDEIKFETRGIKPVWISLIEGKFAKGGTVDDLTKELHKLQRELNSSRLSTYREGDNSPEEQARKRERESKLERFNEVLKTLNEISSKFETGGQTLQMTITKDEFFQRPNEPHRVYHDIEGLYGTYWFKAKTENSHKFGFGSDGINNGGVYQLSVWRGGHPVGRDVSTLGGHVSEDHIASYFNKWEYRSKTKVDKQIVNEIVNWLEANIVDLKRPYTSVKFAVGGNIEEEISYIDRRIKNLRQLLSVSNSDELSDIQKSIDSLEKEKSKLFRTTQYAKGGVTFSDAEQADFDMWMEDGNVSMNNDGSYSTQDAGWRNNLKDLSALKEYYVKEFLSGARYAKGGEIGFDDSGTSMVRYYEKDGNWLVPKGQVYLWLYDVEDASNKLQNSEFDYVFYPHASQSMAWQSGYVPPLKQIWTKKFQNKRKGSEHLLGVIKAFLTADGKELFVDMMSVNPKQKKKGIMSYMIKELRDSLNLDQDQITFSDLTKEGEKFVSKKTYADGGGVVDCIEYIKNSESIKNNGYYLHIDNMNNYVGSNSVIIPKINSLCLITFNSGGQKNLKAVDTINSVVLASEIANLLNIDIEMARIIVYEQTISSKPFTMNMLDGIKNQNIIVADRDTIVCTNLSRQYANGGTIDLFEDYKNIPTALQEVLDEYNEAFEDGDYNGLKNALTAVESIGYTFEYGLDGEAYGLRPKSIPLSQLQGYEDSEEFATGGGVSSGIKSGDWVTLKSDGKRYKVKRVLSNNMIEIVAGTKTLTVSINDVDTNVKFFRSKFVAVPSTIQVKFKVGDRVQFNTKKGITEVGKVLLYKYIPTKNTIIYTIATDSGWKASVLQENLLPDGAKASTIVKAEKITGGLPPKAPNKAQAKSALKAGDKIEIIGAPNLTGTVTKVLSSTNEIEVLLSDSYGIAVKMGKSIPFTYNESKVNKI